MAMRCLDAGLVCCDKEANARTGPSLVGELYSVRALGRLESGQVSLAVLIYQAPDQPYRDVGREWR
jgi:hypothetical protein